LGRGAVSVAALVGAALLLPAAALAEQAPVTFGIPAQPLGEALVKFALQAGVSVGSRDLTGCGPMSRAVVGRYTPAAALARLLDGTRCDFTAVDARAFNVAPRVAGAAVERPNPARVGPEAPAQPNELLLDLTVTTTRRPSLVSRTPASVSVASRAFMAAAHIESLEDLAPEFAGVTVTNLGPGRNKVLVRGLSDGAFTGRTQSTVGLYLDDVPITYNTPDPDLRIIDVERVELLRGPQGPLYGVGSMGGIVRIVTRKPDLAAPAAGAAVGGALTDSGAPSYSVDAMLNLPVVTDRLALRGVAYSETAGGYVEDVALGVKNANRTRRTGGRLAATGVINPDWQATVGFTRQSLRSDDSQYAQGDAGRLQRDNLVREPHGNDFAQAYVSVDGSGRWGRLRLSAAYLHHAFDARYDASNGLLLFGSLSPSGTFDQANNVRLQVAEAVLTSPPGGRLQWLAGAFASRTTDKLHLDISAANGSPDVGLYREDRSDRLREVAVYGEVSYALTPRLTFTAGLRGFDAWLHTDSLRAQQAITRSFSGSLHSQDVSPKVELSWQATPSKLFYLQAAQGYRMGGFNTTGRTNQQFNASTTGNQPNRQYRPDTLWSYEAGAKASFGERRLEVRAAAFYTDWRDVQSDQFLPSGLPYTANVGRAVNIGFEGEAALRVDPAFSLRVSFLVNSPQLIQRDTTYPARPNASLPAVPRYSASVIGDWRREIAPGFTGVLYGRVAYVGASILTFQEQAASQMGNYVTARLAAGIETGAWRLTAYVDNPANAEGDTFAFGDPFTQGRVRQSTPLRPRTVGLTLAMGL
jgi:outer membrane receptor protein involved in Fe transport